jgi:amino acid transporter
MFVWSTLLVTPLIMATGMIGMTDYLRYFVNFTTTEGHWIAVAFTVLTVALLYRRIDSIARLTNILWVGMIVTVIVVIVAAYTHFNAHLAFTYPAGAFTPSVKFFRGLGLGLVLAVFDYFGYYTITYVGEEVRNPGKVIPWSIILSILGVLVIDLTMNIGIIGVVPWQQTSCNGSGVGLAHPRSASSSSGQHLRRCTPACWVPLGCRSTQRGRSCSSSRSGGCTRA